MSGLYFDLNFYDHYTTKCNRVNNQDLYVVKRSDGTYTASNFVGRDLVVS